MILVFENIKRKILIKFIVFSFVLFLKGFIMSFFCVRYRCIYICGWKKVIDFFFGFLVYKYYF